MVFLSPVPEGSDDRHNETENDLHKDDVEHELIHHDLHLTLLESHFLRVHHKLGVVACENGKTYNPLGVL